METIVALAILTFGAAAIFARMAGAGRQGRVIESQTRRELLANQRLHEILAAPYAALAAWKPAAEPAPIAGEAPFLWSATIEKSADGLLRVAVTVGQGSASAPGSYVGGVQTTIEGAKAP